jgi:5-methylcytosine-specific restriction endonuclease McrA
MRSRVIHIPISAQPAIAWCNTSSAAFRSERVAPARIRRWRDDAQASALSLVPGEHRPAQGWPNVRSRPLFQGGGRPLHAMQRIRTETLMAFKRGRPYDRGWRKVRLFILERDGWLCQIRGPKCTKRATQVDHRIPVIAGGSWLDPDNLRASCERCNKSRNRQAIIIEREGGSALDDVKASETQGGASGNPSREW